MPFEKRGFERLSIVDFIRMTRVELVVAHLRVTRDRIPKCFEVPWRWI